MREQLERLVAWAKAHPWLAAAIVGGVILLGYIAYKRSAGGGGGGGGETFEPAEPTPSAGAEFPSFGSTSSGPIGSGIPSPMTSGGEVTTPFEAPASIPAAEPFQFSEPSVSEAFSGIGVSGSEDIAAYSVPAGTPSYSPMEDALETAAPTPRQKAAGLGTASATATRRRTTTQRGEPEKRKRPSAFQTAGQAASITSIATMGIGPVTAVTGAISLAQNIVQNITSPKKKKTIAGQAQARPSSAISSDRPNRQRTTTARTPAALKGLAPNFTGWYQFVYYRNGYPSSPLPVSTPTPARQSKRAR